MIVDLLKTSLANHIEASLVVQSFHWNVEGKDFLQYHDIFSEIYVDLYGQLDHLGEYVRIVSDGQEYVNASVEIVKLNKTLQTEVFVGDNGIKMCNQVISIQDHLIDGFEGINGLSIDNNQYLSNYCLERIDVLKTSIWKLKSITKTQEK